MAKIVIIGAGLTGISAAYHLEKKKFFDYALFEKEPTIGGLCRSVTQDGFTFDYTGHLLHTKDPYFFELIKELVGLEHFHSIDRRSFIYSHNVYTRYPFQINLFGLPTAVISDCIEGYVNRKKIKNPQSFAQWVLTTFGRGFADHFFFPYQEKIFAYKVTKLTARWTQRFVPSTSLHEIIRGALTDHQDKIGYNAHFYYPKQGGIQSWVHTFAQQVQTPMHTSYTVTAINAKDKVVHFANGHSEPYDQLISTMPLNHLLSCLQERSHSSLKKAIGHLKCNQVINFNLGFNRPDVSDKHWIYFPERQYPFYRIGFPHNFAPKVAPKNCSSLYGEIAHINKSVGWQKKMLCQALASVKKLLNVSDQDIATEHIIHIPYAYVIYDAWREQYVPRIINRLKEYDIHSVGRYGAWKYSSMQEAVLDGKAVADLLAIIPAIRESEPKVDGLWKKIKPSKSDRPNELEQ